MTTLNANNTTQSVVVKSQYADREVILDFAATLAGSLTVATATIYSATPVTASPISVTLTAVLGKTATFQISGGLDGVSYGIGIVVTDSNGTTYQQVLAVVVKDDLAIKYQETNPYAFQSLMDALEVGGAAVGKAFFMLPADKAASLTSGYVTWSLLDKNGVVYATGNAYDYSVSATSTYASVSAHAVVNTPFDIEPSNQSDRYQIRWELNLDGVVSQYAFENIRIDSPFSTPTGAQDTVEMQGDLATLDIVLDKAWENVTVDVFTSVGSVKVASSLPILKSMRVSSGWYYQVALDTASFAPSLDPYIVSWKFSNQIGPAYRDTGQLFVVNASILRATKSIEAMVSKAKTTLMGFQDELFTTSVILVMLSRGRDSFNGASGMLTSFDMTNADSYIREYWLKYSEVALLEAQYLLEGEKAYNFTGQAISLDVDRTGYYQSLAQEIKTAIDTDIKVVKQNLIKKGLTGGDGSLVGLGRHGSTGPVGISLSPASPYGRNSNFFFNR